MDSPSPTPSTAPRAYNRHPITDNADRRVFICFIIRYRITVKVVGTGWKGRAAAASLGALLLAVAAASVLLQAPAGGGGGEGGELIVYHAGSLTGVVEDLGEIMRARYGVELINEPSGSMDVVRKVTDLGKRPDVVAVADHRLIRDLMMPAGKASWDLVFASNEMVVVYTDSSRYSEEIGPDNWLDVLMRPGVRVGFSDPNRDPCGYRAIMVLALAALDANTTAPLDLLAERAGIGYEVADGSIRLDATGVEPDSEKVFVREKSVDLVSMVESGVLDYAFEYRSVAVSHGLRYVALPGELNLADPSMGGWYSRVGVLIAGPGGETKLVEGAPITYGLTVPGDAPHPDLARRFVELLISGEGRAALEENGFTPITPEALGSPPGWLSDLMGGG